MVGKEGDWPGSTASAMSSFVWAILSIFRWIRLPWTSSSAIGVINLTPDKLASFKEIHRILKPGGRILIADLVTAAELPAGRAGQPVGLGRLPGRGHGQRGLPGDHPKGSFCGSRRGFPNLLMRPLAWMSGCKGKSSVSRCGPGQGVDGLLLAHIQIFDQAFFATKQVILKHFKITEYAVIIM